jgi:hypothetical protein
MKSPVVSLLSALLGAFLGGVATYEFLEAKIETHVAPVRALAESAHVRIEGIRLGVGAVVVGDHYGAQEGDENDPNDFRAGKQGYSDHHFMVGQWDGTGTHSGWSRNYYREVSLTVPPKP